MTKIVGLITVLLLLCGAYSNAHADIVVIVHPDNATMTMDVEELQDIYLGRSNRFQTGQEVVPIDQKLGVGVRESFNQEILGRTSKQVKAYWAQLVFTGRGWPPVQMSDNAAVKAAVAQDPLAIGYIDATFLDDTVKVVHRIP